MAVINAVDGARFPLLVGRVAQGMLGAPQGTPAQVFSATELEKLQVSLELEESSLTLLLDSIEFILKQVTTQVSDPLLTHIYKLELMPFLFKIGQFILFFSYYFMG